jgi:hypothetical protein
MRLWSLHPQYVDSKGLVALWREGLLAQAVLVGKTIGYKHHPQLVRFLQSSSPRKYIAAYLRPIHDEAVRRGYHFDEKKIGRGSTVKPLLVTRGQLEYDGRISPISSRHALPLGLITLKLSSSLSLIRYFKS